jgi:hypothetical protein
MWPGTSEMAGPAGNSRGPAEGVKNKYQNRSSTHLLQNVTHQADNQAEIRLGALAGD